MQIKIDTYEDGHTTIGSTGITGMMNKSLPVNTQLFEVEDVLGEQFLENPPEFNYEIQGDQLVITPK